ATRVHRLFPRRRRTKELPRNASPEFGSDRQSDLRAPDQCPAANRSDLESVSIGHEELMLFPYRESYPVQSHAAAGAFTRIQIIVACSNAARRKASFPPLLVEPG